MNSIDLHGNAAQKQTVGAAAVKLLEQGDTRQSVMDTKDAMLKGYPDALIDCALKHKREWTQPFYVCVQTRRERLLTNVIRNQFYARQTRPIPDYDLALYHFDPATDDLRFVWNIPDKSSVEQILSDYQTGTLPKEYMQLASFCVGFKNCTLV